MNDNQPLLRLGFLIDFISVPVIAGFTSAAAITIASSQVIMMTMALNEVVVVVVNDVDQYCYGNGPW